MKEVPLTTYGYVAIVDDAYYEEASLYTWRLLKGRHTYYAAAYSGHGTRRRTLLLHRLIMDAHSGEQIDHINGDGLDNRVCNLRFCNASQNAANKRSVMGSSSRFKGVSARPDRPHPWMARIEPEGGRIHLGYFDSEEDAARAYNIAAIEHFGEFARLNEV